MSGQGRVPDYNFLCGVFRSRESALLSASRIEGLVAARDFADALAQLPDGAFALETRKDPGTGGIEAGFRTAVAEMKGLVGKYSPSTELNDLAFLPWDFHNLKAAMLQKLTGTTVADLFGPEGSVTAAALMAMAEAMRFDSLPKPLAASLEKALIAYYETGKDPQAFELGLDRQKTLRLIEIASSAGPAVRAYYAGLEDASVADSFIRLHLARVPWQTVQAGFAGHPDASVLKDLYTLSPSEWSGRLAAVSRASVRLLLSAASAAPDPGALLQGQKKKAFAVMRDWRFKPPSLEYALYYVTRLLADLANLRLVLLCKLNRIEGAEIGKRVIDAFV
jgi:vacuolar-type H+-ATPase subunit C/Vma6